MEYCAAVRATYRKQLNGGGGESGGVWTVLLSEVTLFEYNISTILSPTCLFRSCHLDICLMIPQSQKYKTACKDRSIA